MKLTKIQYVEQWYNEDMELEEIGITEKIQNIIKPHLTAVKWNRRSFIELLRFKHMFRIPIMKGLSDE